MPKGFSGATGPFAWTPDSASLVIGHDDQATPYAEGYLSLFDADGEAGAAPTDAAAALIRSARCLSTQVPRSHPCFGLRTGA